MGTGTSRPRPPGLAVGVEGRLVGDPHPQLHLVVDVVQPQIRPAAEARPIVLDPDDSRPQGLRQNRSRFRSSHDSGHVALVGNHADPLGWQGSDDRLKDASKALAEGSLLDVDGDLKGLV
jgi:hypothetical protein